ncbi:hypothetical protein Lepto7376_3408 [[Leptolyngbya] sp. PCC 7376]|uniref:hypothetical protein n=1 Tax=[Leptolyngbya] sp. PCC 7376 TaxID=111781 RepID=UPI00029F0063|nr:hypothetical protein [[Leptolyngbya] sp. PCC 7376]AFY39613.1 hypothetical protein Lepto7376_3408 [[Leptolyngbya] sp. PCC 7376]
MPTTNLEILMNIQQVCDRILSAGELTRDEHMQLMTTCLNDALVNTDERHSINRVLDEIQFGKLQFVEPEPAS